MTLVDIDKVKGKHDIGRHDKVKGKHGIGRHR